MKLTREWLAKLRALLELGPVQEPDQTALRRELAQLEAEYQSLYAEVMRTDTTHQEHGRAMEQFLVANGGEGFTGRMDEIRDLLLTPAERQAQAEHSAAWQAQLQRMTAEEIDQWLCERIRATHDQAET